MLTEICAYLKNWFVVQMCFGDFKIVDGMLTYANGDNLPLKDGQYFRIIGSIFNDGVKVFSPQPPEPPTSGEPQEGLKDEEFSGAVWTMAVPKGLIDLAAEIEAWLEQYGGAGSEAMSPFNSESFGGYSYSKSSGGSGGSGSGAGGSGWLGAFGDRLAIYRKI